LWGEFTTFAASMRFLGNIDAKTDAKGRVFLPSPFRKVLQATGEETLVLRKDVHQKCLVLYPLSSWNRRMDTILSKVNEFDDEGQMVVREFVSAATEVTLDGNGRFLIPKAYLQMAEIAQSVRFIGMNDTIEIWSEENASAPFMSQEAFSSKLKALMTAQ